MYIDFFILRKQLVFLQWQIQFYMEINIFYCDLRHEYETAETLILFEDTMLAHVLYDFWITCRPAVFCFAWKDLLLQSLSAPFFCNCSAHYHGEVCFPSTVAYDFWETATILKWKKSNIRKQHRVFLAVLNANYPLEIRKKVSVVRPDRSFGITSKYSAGCVLRITVLIYFTLSSF